MFIINFDDSINFGKFDSEDKSVAEAIYTVYLDYGDSFILNWNNYLIPLSKKGDLSEIYNDLTRMLNFIKMDKEKEFFINFLSSTFTAKWDFKIFSRNEIHISAKWDSKNIFSNKIENQNNSNIYNILVNKNIFISQWDNLLRSLKKDLLNVGYIANNLDGFSYLEKL